MKAKPKALVKPKLSISLDDDDEDKKEDGNEEKKDDEDDDFNSRDVEDKQDSPDKNKQQPQEPSDDLDDDAETKDRNSESPNRVKEGDGNGDDKDKEDKKEEDAEASKESAPKKDEGEDGKDKDTEGKDGEKEEEPKEGEKASSESEVKVSDVFLNMEMKAPSYIKNEESKGGEDSKEAETADAGEKTGKDNATIQNIDEDDDDDADFERDENTQDPIANAASNMDSKGQNDGGDEEANVREEDAEEGNDAPEGQSRNDKLNGSGLRMKVNINVTNLDAKKPNAQQAKVKAKKTPQPLMKNDLLDLLFSFVGVSSKPDD